MSLVCFGKGGYTIWALKLWMDEYFDDILILYCSYNLFFLFLIVSTLFHKNQKLELLKLIFFPKYQRNVMAVINISN